MLPARWFQIAHERPYDLWTTVASKPRRPKARVSLKPDTAAKQASKQEFSGLRVMFGTIFFCSR